MNLREEITQKVSQQPAAHRLGGILATNLDSRHPKVGSDLEGVRIPPPSR